MANEKIPTLGENAPSNLLGLKETASEILGYMNKTYIMVKAERDAKTAECLEKDAIILDREKTIQELKGLLSEKEKL